ncbi:hypothetical protein D7V93_43145, partial [Corallococcus llansteffanensis]
MTEGSGPRAADARRATSFLNGAREGRIGAPAVRREAAPPRPCSGVSLLCSAIAAAAMSPTRVKPAPRVARSSMRPHVWRRG